MGWAELSALLLGLVEKANGPYTIAAALFVTALLAYIARLNHNLQCRRLATFERIVMAKLWAASEPLPKDFPPKPPSLAQRMTLRFPKQKSPPPRNDARRPPR